jgi:hypothetical protein
VSLKGEEAMKCSVCSREAQEEGFCSLHLDAYRNIVGKFGVWQRALGLSWMEYLVGIQKNSLTGVWAKEVSKRLIEDEEEKQSCLEK